MVTKILSATQQTGYIELSVVDVDITGTEIGDPYPYQLYEADPYGNSPALRDELHRMVDAGEIVIEQPPAAEGTDGST